MATEIFLLTILLIVFAVALAVICVFLFNKIIKAEGVARPFLISLFLYFLLLCIANIQQVIYNFINMETLILPSEPLRVYTTFFVFVLTLASPIYLIFQIEKIYFPDSKITAKYHFATIINVILFVGFIGYVGYLASTDIAVITDFKIADFIFICGTLLGFEVLFVIVAFAYLAAKSGGKMKFYARIIWIGWLLNYGVNIVTVLATLPPNVIIILLIPKLVGVAMTAIGLYRLYGLGE
jgi:hypothetical protein